MQYTSNFNKHNKNFKKKNNIFTLSQTKKKN